ncbi:Suppressor of glycerol defect protein [Lachnellula suecica]|uniref:Suppressor of glycerol defect protein n=1 Tax=Lachnellula suecica TaxID=602035 RepID=A0A8T9C147_9HELO|nr:Suppressor of glycerol defect protein [Lachnellula suecica]
MAPPFKLKLPKLLLDELGSTGGLSSNSRPRQGPGSRKESRKAARVEKKAIRNGPPPAKRTKLRHAQEISSKRERPLSEQPSRREPARQQPHSAPKSILKTTKKADPSRSISPEPLRISTSVKNKLAEDDEEIAALEKKLGLKGKKLPQSFKEDGLDELLEGLDEDEDSDDVQDSRKRKAESDEWLDQKRRKARKARGLPDSGEDVDEDEEEDVDSEDDDGTSDEDESILKEDGFEGFDDSDSGEEQPRVRENPYVAPLTVTTTQKYIPPSLRQLGSSDSDALVRLRRQMQGLVNRLTEANLISILGDIEKLYREHPRQHVTTTLGDLLLTSVCEPSSLPDTLIILPAGFIAATYKIIGMDVGAQIVQRIVELFDEHYVNSISSSKETSNLIMLLSEMYIFQVIGSNLIMDYIRLFLETFTELHAELILKIVRAAGPQLRRDDPSSLKDIVTMLGSAVDRAGGKSKLEPGSKMKFMVETINDLKDNKMKTGGAASAVTSEHIIRMKKTLGTLNTRSIKASEPLRIGLKDIKDSDKKGKWWMVGASWSGDTAEEVNPVPVLDIPTLEAGEVDLIQLAKEQRMNTDVRRKIFMAIMSAVDYKDANLRLIKLQLKKVQEYEIPKVLIHCSGAEKAYNPYYTLVAKNVCGDRKLKMSFQFCLWDIFKKMGESDDDEAVEEDGADPMDLRRIVNLGKMFGTLIAEGALGLNVLKNLNLSYLQPKTKTFMEVLLITVFVESQKSSKRDEQAVAKIIDVAKGTPQLITGLQYFLRKVVSKTEIAGGKREATTVKWACAVAKDTLEHLVAIDNSSE